jgi:hypothetical protein
MVARVSKWMSQLQAGCEGIHTRLQLNELADISFSRGGLTLMALNVRFRVICELISCWLSRAPLRTSWTCSYSFKRR